MKDKLLSFIKKTLLFFLLSSVFMVVLYRFVPVYFTPLMVIRMVERKMDGKDFRFKRDWEPMENMSRNLPLAVVASEDQKFLEHNGFDFAAMKKAYEGNKNGKRIKGGSTISQQLAKNVFLWQGRSYFRKVLEAYFTFLIELIWTKERILEVYLNVVEMGTGVYGAEAASHYYFKTSAINLSKSQAAWIACILPCPLKYDPNRPSAYLSNRHSHTLRQMNYMGKLEL